MMPPVAESSCSHCSMWRNEQKANSLKQEKETFLLRHLFSFPPLQSLLYRVRLRAANTQVSPSILAASREVWLLTRFFKEGCRSPQSWSDLLEVTWSQGQRESAFGGLGAAGPCGQQGRPSKGGGPEVSKGRPAPRVPARATQRGAGRAGKEPPVSICAGSAAPRRCSRSFRLLGLCRADALPACEQGLFSLHALGLRS